MAERLDQGIPVRVSAELASMYALFIIYDEGEVDRAIEVLEKASDDWFTDDPGDTWFERLQWELHEAEIRFEAYYDEN